MNLVGMAFVISYIILKFLRYLLIAHESGLKIFDVATSLSQKNPDISL
jgi:hypothetical protein